jgi:hypothetical protein
VEQAVVVDLRQTVVMVAEGIEAVVEVVVVVVEMDLQQVVVEKVGTDM